MSEKLSQIASGGTISPTTDQLVTVRSGATDVLTTPGQAAAKAVSNNSNPLVASVATTSISANHIAQFADTAGTIQDGGVLGTSANQAASSITGTVAAVNGGVTAGHLAVFSDTAGTIQDGGAPGSGGVSTLNGLSGAVSITAGTNISVSLSGQDVVITNTQSPSAGMTPAITVGVPSGTPSFGTGQLAYDSTDAMKAYIYNGSAYIPVEDILQDFGWDGTNCPTLTLTSSNTVANWETATGSTTGPVLAYPAKSGGKRYFEMVVTTANLNSSKIGICYANQQAFGTAGNTQECSVGWNSADGTVNASGPSQQSNLIGVAATWLTTNQLSVAVDIPNQLIWFRVGSGNWNNSGSANPATGAGGFSFAGYVLTPLTPMANLTAQETQTATINLGTSSFVEGVPSGFTSWVA